MNLCLSNKTLYLLYAGEGYPSQQLHLAQCALCTHRYEQISQRLSSVEQILRHSPLFSEHATQWQPQFVYRHRFFLATAAAVIILAFVWGTRGSQDLSQQLWPGIDNQEVTRFFEHEVSPALFATADIPESPMPTPISDIAYLEAALTDGWPCEQREASNAFACEIHPFPLPNEDY